MQDRTSPALPCPPLGFLLREKSCLFDSSTGVEFLMDVAKFNTNRHTRTPENQSTLKKQEFETQMEVEARQTKCE